MLCAGQRRGCRAGRFHRKSYADYADAHVRELIGPYAPSVLWNDICWPPDADLAALFALLLQPRRRQVVNDRWLQRSMPRNRCRTPARGAGEAAAGRVARGAGEVQNLTFPASTHYDFRTPSTRRSTDQDEEVGGDARGGALASDNRNERPQDIITATGVIRMLCDVVSKNGNLLIGIGGPRRQHPRTAAGAAAGLGAWLAVSGEAIYASRPGRSPPARTTEGTEVRFTQREVTSTDPPRAARNYGVRPAGSRSRRR